MSQSNLALPSLVTRSFTRQTLDVLLKDVIGRLRHVAVVVALHLVERYVLVAHEFQFQHAQMDGIQACCFLDNLQHEINRLMRKYGNLLISICYTLRKSQVPATRLRLPLERLCDRLGAASMSL